MEMMVSVLVSAETMESAMAHQGIGAVGEEVAFERAAVGGLLRAKAQAEEGDADEVDGDEGKIDGMETRRHSQRQGFDTTGQCDSPDAAA